MNFNHKLLVLFFIGTCLMVVVPSCTARGGRGRGGGSFGGLFGGWRKYKKPSSSGSGRRVVSGEPMYTSMSIPKPQPPPAPPKAIMKPKPQIPSYPRQQMPTGFTGYGQGGMGGTYYANPQAMPAGAVFYAQPPPMSMSRGSGTGDFLTGMLAGHMMNNLLYGRRQHHYHRNREDEPPAQTQSNNGREIIIIENGTAQNESSIPEEAIVSTPENPLTDGQSSSEPEDGEDQVTPEPISPVNAGSETGPIICFPIMLNETDTENPDEIRQVERIVCFPAPTDTSYIDDSITTTTEPRIVAGDIGVSDSEDTADEDAAADADADADVNPAPIVSVASYVADRGAAHTTNVNA